MNVYRHLVDVYVSGLLATSHYIWTSCHQPLHETIDRRWNSTLCITHHRTEARQVAFLCNKAVGLSVLAKWWTTDVQVHQTRCSESGRGRNTYHIHHLT